MITGMEVPNAGAGQWEELIEWAGQKTKREHFTPVLSKLVYW